MSEELNKAVNETLQAFRDAVTFLYWLDGDDNRMYEGHEKRREEVTNRFEKSFRRTFEIAFGKESE